MPLRPRLRPVAVATAVLAGLTAGVLTAPAAQAATPIKYHVNCSAKTSGDGSEAKPWNRLSSANGRVFLPGEQLLLKRGTTCSGQLAPAGSGTSAARITLSAYGKGALPTVAGKGTPNGTGAVQLVDSQYWTVSNLHVTNSTTAKNPTTYRSGVLVLNTGVGRLKGITVRDLTVDAVRSNPADGILGPRDWGGISALTYGPKKDGFDGLRIAGNTVKNVSRTGIVVSNHHYPTSYDTGTRVDHNTVSRARGDSIFVLGTKKGTIDRNVARDGGDILPCPECGRSTKGTASVGIWTTRSDRMLIERNEVSGQYAEAGDGEGFDLDASATNAVLQYNYAHDNDGGGVLLCGSKNATVRFNILENNAKSAIAFIGSVPAKNSQIYNNTIYGSSKSKSRPVRYFNGKHGSGIVFKNNIVYNYGYASWLWIVKPKTAANTLIGLHSTGRPADSLTSYRNPGLKNPGTGRNGLASLKGYKPAHSSSFTKGVAIPKSVTRDFFGKKINPKHPPRGAAG